MKIFEKEIRFNEEVNFELNGSFLLRVAGSNNQYDSLRITHCLSDSDVEINISEKIVLVKDKSRELSRHDVDFNNFKKSITNNEGVVSAITSFLSDAVQFVNKEKTIDHTISVEVVFGEGSSNKSILIKSDNLKTEFDQVNIGSVNLSAGNLKLEQGGLTSSSLKVKSGNLKASIFFNQNNRKINIDSANAKINVNHHIGFNGLVLISGHNLKVDGIQNNSGDERCGKLKAKLNNGDVKFIRDELNQYQALPIENKLEPSN